MAQCRARLAQGVISGRRSGVQAPEPEGRGLVGWTGWESRQQRLVLCEHCLAAGAGVPLGSPGRRVELAPGWLFRPVGDRMVGRRAEAEGVRWYLSDHLGTVRDLADAAGEVIDHIAYDSFGNVLAESNPAAGDRFRFTGREFDAATGQYYYRARYYDGRIGRFTSEDPLGLAAGDVNLYRYVRNRPASESDPTGLIRREEVPGSAAGENGQFHIEWNLTLDRPYNFDVVVIQHFRVRPRDVRSFITAPDVKGGYTPGQRAWSYPYLEPAKGGHEWYEYYEVVGIVRGRARQPGPGLIERYQLRDVVRAGEQLRDFWEFGGRLLGEEATQGAWEISGHVRVIRLTEEIAKDISKHRGIGGLRLLFVSDKERRGVPWTSGVFRGYLARPAWFDTGEILEREQEGGADKYTQVTVTWDYRFDSRFGRPIPQPGTITRG